MAEDWFNALTDEAANGVSAIDAVGAVLGGPAGAVALGASVAARAAAGGGGSWSFDKDEIDAVIAEWNELAEQIGEDRAQLNSLVDALTIAPSEDNPTRGYVNAVSDGVAGLDESNFSMNRYVAEFVGKLEDAKKSISSRDETSAETFGSDRVEEV